MMSKEVSTATAGRLGTSTTSLGKAEDPASIQCDPFTDIHTFRTQHTKQADLVLVTNSTIKSVFAHAVHADSNQELHNQCLKKYVLLIEGSFEQGLNTEGHLIKVISVQHRTVQILLAPSHSEISKLQMQSI